MKKLLDSQLQILIEIRTNCPKCKGIGFLPHNEDYAYVEKCECIEKIARLYQYFLSNIPVKFVDMTLKDYTQPLPKRFKTFYRDMKKWLDKGIGLYLHGLNGTGKSFLAAELIKKALNLGYSAYFISLEQLLAKIMRSFDDEDLKEEIERIRNVDFLLIDEIEKAYKPSKESSFAEIVFDDLFRTRSNEMKTVCVTSNKKLEDLKGTHSQHLISLFRENLVPVEMLGQDFRKEIAKHLGEVLDK